MQTISINFIVPQGWHERSDKQLRYVYQLIADNLGQDMADTISNALTRDISRRFATL